MQQGHDIGSAMYCYIQKQSAIDIAFRKALLSLSEQKNEDTQKIVYRPFELEWTEKWRHEKNCLSCFGSYLIFDIAWNPENEY